MLILILPLEIRYHSNHTTRLVLMPEHWPGDTIFIPFGSSPCLLYVRKPTRPSRPPGGSVGAGSGQPWVKFRLCCLPWLLRCQSRFLQLSTERDDDNYTYSATSAVRVRGDAWCQGLAPSSRWFTHISHYNCYFPPSGSGSHSLLLCSSLPFLPQTPIPHPMCLSPPWLHSISKSWSLLRRSLSPSRKTISYVSKPSSEIAVRNRQHGTCSSTWHVLGA